MLTCWKPNLFSFIARDKISEISIKRIAQIFHLCCNQRCFLNKKICKNLKQLIRTFVQGSQSNKWSSQCNKGMLGVLEK